MKKAFAGSLLFASLVAAPAFAEQGFSAGASIGYTTLEIEDQGASVEFDDVGYKIFGNWMFTDNFGIEGGWIDFGNLSATVGGIDAEVDADGFDLFVVGALPVSETFDLFAKAGMLSWDADFAISGTSQGSDSGEDLAFGLGGRFKTAGGFGVRAEWEMFDIEDTDTTWMTSLGFEYLFK